MTKRVKTGYVVFLLYMLFVVVAMSDNFKGIIIPSLKSEFGINNTQIAYFLTFSMLSFAVFQFIGGVLVEKYGKKKVLQVGFIVTTISLGLLFSSKSYLAIIASLMLVNAGVAMFAVVVSTLGPALPVASTAVLMNMIAFTYGASATVLQKVSGVLLGRGYSWKTFFGFMMAFTVLLFVYTFFIEIPESDDLGNQSKDPVKFREVISDKRVLLYIACLGFYLSSDMGTGNWFANYMNEAFKYGPDQRGLYVSIFFGTLTIGRLAGGFVAEKLGYFKSIISFAVTAALSIILGLFLGKTGIIIIAISGLFFSLIYGVIITTLSVTFNKNVSYITGVILMGSYIISTLVSFIIGVLNDVIGVSLAYGMIPLGLIVSAICAFRIQIIVKNEEDEIKEARKVIV